MEQAFSSLEVSVTIPSAAASDLGGQFETLEIEKTPDLSTYGTPTVNCERKDCKRLVPQATVRKVKAREPNGATKAMFVCQNCFNHYQAKSSTTSANRKYLFLFFGRNTNASLSYRGHSVHLRRQLQTNTKGCVFVSKG